MQPQHTLDTIRKKILTPETLVHEIERLRFFSKKIVFTNGCFDILHLGHIDYLTKAADLGDILIVAINTDASVSKLKGPSRPINHEEQRSMLVAALQMVDRVILFNENTPYELIKTIQPDVLVKGADYKLEQIVGYDIVKAKKGEVVTIEFLDGYSTSAIEQKIKNTK